MQINWRVRLRNRVFLAGMAATVLSFVFDVLAMLDITPALSEDSVMQLISALLTVLTGLGVVIDPTTQGAGDSPRAMQYE